MSFYISWEAIKNLDNTVTNDKNSLKQEHELTKTKIRNILSDFMESKDYRDLASTHPFVVLIGKISEIVK